MLSYLTMVFLLLFYFGLSFIDAQTGSMLPITGQVQSLADETVFRMISERDCVSLCVRDQSLPCFGISYETYRQECRIIRAVISSVATFNASFANWRSYVHTKDV